MSSSASLSSCTVTTAPPADWTTLPVDVQTLIFGSANLQTVLTLRQVCKRWRDSASGLRMRVNISDDKLQRLTGLFPKLSELFLSTRPDGRPADLQCLSSLSDLRQLHCQNATAEQTSTLASLRNITVSLRSLTINPVSARSPGVSTVLYEPLTAFQNLRSFSVGVCPLQQGLEIAAQLHHLTFLSMFSLPQPPREGIIAEYGSRLSPLISSLSLAGVLRINRDDMDAICRSLPALSVLNLRIAGVPLNQPHLAFVSPPTAEAAKCLSSLVEMSLPMSFYATDSMTFPSRLTRLSAMVMPNDKNPPIHVLQKLSVSSPHLQVIQILVAQLSDEYLEVLSRFSRLRKLNLAGNIGGAPVAQTDEGFGAVTRLKLLDALSLACLAKLTDVSVRSIAALSSLTELRIRSCRFSAAGLANLSSLHRLVSLSIDSSLLDDTALEAIVRENTSLTVLHVPNTRISSPRDLSCLTNLTDINFSGCKVSDSTIASLADLRQLVSVIVIGTPISGIGFANLKSRSSLLSLSFSSTTAPLCLTAEGARCMAQFPHVASISLSDACDDDVFHALLSNGRYKYAYLRKTKLSQVPSLMLCTTLRSLTLTDPEEAICTGDTADRIAAALPRLFQFSITANGVARAVRGELPAFAAPAVPKMVKKAAAKGPAPFAKK